MPLPISTSVLSAQSSLNSAQPRNQTAPTGLDLILARIEQQRVVRAGSRIKSDVADLKDAFRALRLNSRSTGSSAASASVLGANLSLNQESSAAQLSSSEAINTDTTTFSPVSPAWNGLSSADPVFAGFYDGSQGTDTFTFTVTQAGVHGSSTAEIEVRDSGSSLLDTLTVAATDPIDTSYALSNGIQVTFGAGVFVLGDTFTLDVTDSVDRQPDPDAAFNAQPGFENGASVTAGSFTVNGELIGVLADDTINSVLSRINASAAGVSATFDSGAESITLIQNTAGSGPTIDLADDTSGFLVATKLDTATLQPGSDSDLNRALTEVASFSSVSAGTLNLAGQLIVIDPATDSLSDIIAALQQSGSGLEVNFFQNSRLILSSPNSFVVDGGGTGFFAAMGIDNDTYAATSSTVTTQIPNARINQIVRATDDLLGRLGKLLARTADTPELAPLSELKSRIDSILTDEFDASLNSFGVDSGLRFGPQDSARRYVQIQESGLKLGLKRELSNTMDVYLGDNNQPGFLDQIVTAVDQAIRGFNEPGLLIDTEV